MNTATEILSGLFVLLGAFLMLISAIGILRLPDFYSRLSAVTKNSTIGVVFIIVGAIIYFNNIEVLMKGAGIVLFIALTSPTSAFVIGKAAVHVKVPFWGKTDKSDFEGVDEGTSDREKELVAKGEHLRRMLLRKKK